jgi:tRNA-dihydrouridine synthase C
MNLLPKNKDGCPFLILAPMEGVGDRSFRKAMASVGGFDEGVRDFLRVPSQPHIPSLAAKYESDELTPIPLAAQLMGSDPYHMAAMAREMEARGAKRIDLNCGCPSNTVTGRGAGSSLLREPGFLYEIAKAMVNAVSVPVTAKLRSGFEDTSLFKENLLAAQESGISFLTLHPRTKVEGYGPPARWDLIAEAKSILNIPVVGNGDILNVQDALRMVQETNCDALMIGRGSIINPFIFHQIKAHYAKQTYAPSWENLNRYFSVYLAEMAPELSEKSKIGKMKQLMGFLFKANDKLMALRNDILRAEFAEMPPFLEFAMGHLQKNLSFI